MSFLKETPPYGINQPISHSVSFVDGQSSSQLIGPSVS
jgi:hypothetical protein